MQFEDEFRLSFYEPLTAIDDAHGVFLMRHKSTGQLYVWKELTIFSSDVFHTLEAHPVEGMPRIAEVIEDGEKLIVIEEYINGVTLEQLTESGALVDEAKALKYFTELLAILKQLQSFRPPIVHRDIKPANIIITQDDHVRLVDLNAAKFVDKSTNRDTELLGTFGYAAPEQYGFSSSDIRTDIYGAGILLNVMLTGKLPSEEKAPGPLGRIVDKCTRMEPKDRYQNVDEIYSDLNARLTQKTVKEAKVPKAAPVAATGRSRSDYFPPGFRSCTLWKMILAVPLYVFLLWFTFTFKTEAPPEYAGSFAYSIPFYRLILFLMIFPSIFFLRNYLDIWNIMGLRRIRNRFLQILAILGVELAYILSVFMLALLLVLIST